MTFIGALLIAEAGVVVILFLMFVIIFFRSMIGK